MQLESTIVTLNARLRSRDEEEDSGKMAAQKIAMLTRNLDNLMIVQRELASENEDVKKSLRVREALLDGKNEHIVALEKAIEKTNSDLREQQLRHEDEMKVLVDALHTAGPRLQDWLAPPSPTGESRLVKPIRGGRKK